MNKISPHCVDVQHLVVVLLHNDHDHDDADVAHDDTDDHDADASRDDTDGDTDDDTDDDHVDDNTCMYWTALISVWKVLPQGDE